MRHGSLSAWRKVAEHPVKAFAGSLDVLGEVVRERVACRTAPDQLLVICVEDVHYECADLVGFNCRRGVPKAAEPTPAPSTPETIVEGVKCLLIVRCFDCYDSSVRAGWHFCPPLRGQDGIYGRLDSVHHERIARPYPFP